MSRNYGFMKGLLIFSILVMACFANAEEVNKSKLYTAYNMWYQKSNMDCVNYQMGSMLPAGTEVQDAQVVRPVSEKFGNLVPYITFTVVATGKKFEVAYEPSFHPKRAVQDYYNLMFTKQTFDELTQGMSEVEIKAIKEGVLLRGMSKKAVIVSVGVPPDHKTPSLEGNQWYFWKTRITNKLICFNSEGKTADCVDSNLLL
jgi:hypothetical protein